MERKVNVTGDRAITHKDELRLLILLQDNLIQQYNHRGYC